MTNESALNLKVPQADPHGHDHAHDHGHAHDHDGHAHEGHGHAHAPAHAHAHAEPACCGSPVVRGSTASATPADLPKGALLFRIPTMDCAVEESEIRRALEPIAGVKALRFRLGERTMAITTDEGALPQALDAIRKAGFKPEPVDVQGGAAPAAAPATIAGMNAGLVRLVAALVLAIAAESISFMGFDGKAFMAAEMALALGAIGLAGLDTYKKGFAALVRGRLNINALMAVAVTGAFVIGQWPEAAMVMALYAIAELIEARAVDRARNAIQSLLALAPEQAEVKQPDGSWQTVRAGEVALDAVARIRPGERVPLDGIVTAGASAIDQAPVTGESIPVDKTVGDPVFAGTINQTAALEFRVTAVASNTTLARIIHAVEEAQGSRAPTQRFVDRFAAVYTPTVFVLALAVALFTPLFMDWTWTQALYKALVLLVIACPCALVISTPVTVVSALASAARRGILIKGGTYLEEARKLKAIALDKTGTITEGKPKLVASSLHGAPAGASADEAVVFATAASIAGRSDHPVSKAIAEGLKGARAEEAGDFTALPGRGVQAVVAGQTYVLGNHRLIEERGLCTPALEAELKQHEEAGRTVTLLASDTAVLALFAVADTIKASSQAAVAELRALGVVPVMLTGDNAATARTIGAHAGIEDVRGNLLPEEKLDAIKAMQQRYGAAAMTGDGINDAPALAQADIGFAMGGAGTDTAMEAADVVIMNDDLRRIPETIRLSRRAHAVLWQNITLALGIKAVFFVLAVFGSATMWMAVFADMGASLLVVANGLRLMRAPKD
ncbi:MULTISPECIES: cation-translocating P-type ATPase [unclassified Variovorax]|uniref:heavy metal translocating P-type ATPase n=1 Tax=unclassified Variovorax TaxID=663243 RepID=UPI0008AD051C|nr:MULTISPECIES: heavy metal translocating P-type ATPase [unclassified Variovorax]SEJ46949.1 Cd2+/Zn2+-exporting ATPase [Variovorax sp. OK202]SFC47452.1 Cd2+/Zn2+-exporting ATPase [Variovorax sp. OK212]